MKCQRKIKYYLYMYHDSHSTHGGHTEASTHTSPSSPPVNSVTAQTSVHESNSDFYLQIPASLWNLDLSYKMSPYRRYFLFAARQLDLSMISEPSAKSKQSMQSTHSTPSNSCSITVTSAAASALANSNVPVQRSSISKAHSQKSPGSPTPLSLSLLPLFPLPAPTPSFPVLCSGPQARFFLKLVSTTCLIRDA